MFKEHDLEFLRRYRDGLQLLEDYNAEQAAQKPQPQPIKRVPQVVVENVSTDEVMEAILPRTDHLKVVDLDKGDFTVTTPFEVSRRNWIKTTQDRIDRNGRPLNSAISHGGFKRG